MLRTDAGEDWVAGCGGCGYAANVEKAESVIPEIADGEGLAEPEKFPTPGVKTIDDLAKMDGGAAGDRQIKTLVYKIDEKEKQSKIDNEGARERLLAAHRAQQGCRK